MVSVKNGCSGISHNMREKFPFPLIFFLKLGMKVFLGYIYRNLLRKRSGWSGFPFCRDTEKVLIDLLKI